MREGSTMGDGAHSRWLIMDERLDVACTDEEAWWSLEDEPK